jgi:hypothetical protein
MVVPGLQSIRTKTYSRLAKNFCRARTRESRMPRSPIGEKLPPRRNRMLTIGRNRNARAGGR